MPRANVFNLRCLLNRLPGKPLGPIDQAPCNYTQPQRLEALYNIRDVATLFESSVLPAPTPTFYVDPRLAGPGLDAPRGSLAPSPQTPGEGVFGYQLNSTLDPEPFSYAIFQVFESHDIKGR